MEALGEFFILSLKAMAEDSVSTASLLIAVLSLLAHHLRAWCVRAPGFPAQVSSDLHPAPA